MGRPCDACGDGGRVVGVVLVMDDCSGIWARWQSRWVMGIVGGLCER